MRKQQELCGEGRELVVRHLKHFPCLSSLNTSPKSSSCQQQNGLRSCAQSLLLPLSMTTDVTMAAKCVCSYNLWANWVRKKGRFYNLWLIKFLGYLHTIVKKCLLCTFSFFTAVIYLCINLFACFISLFH